MSTTAFALGVVVGIAVTMTFWVGSVRVEQARRQAQAEAQPPTESVVRPTAPRLPVRCVQEHEFTAKNESKVRLRTWTHQEAEAAYHRAAMLKRTADEGGLWNDVRRRAREASINEMLDILICYGMGVQP